MSDDIGGLVILALVGFGLYSAFSPNNADRFIAYEGVCWAAPSSGTEFMEWDKCGSTQGAHRSVNEVRFRVDPQHQRVFELGVFSQRYDDCIVADTKNWRCRSSAGSTISVNDGVYSRQLVQFGRFKTLGYLEYQQYRWGLKK